MSTTKTVTVGKTPGVPNRAFDHVYDPNYTMSDSRDLARAQYRADMQNSKVLHLPNRANMFSELQHYPGTTSVLITNNPLPPGMQSDFATKQFQQTIQHVSEYNAVQPTGRDRPLFNAQPIIPGAAAQSTSFVKFAPPPVVTAVQQAPSEESMSRTRTVFVQTDYR